MSSRASAAACDAPLTPVAPRGVLAGEVDPSRLTFLDLKWDVVERELARVSAGTRSGPHAENILRDVGVVAARLH